MFAAAFIEPMLGKVHWTPGTMGAGELQPPVRSAKACLLEAYI